MKTKAKILVVDDDASLLVTVGDMLRFEGYEVVTAESGEQALKRLDGFTPAVIVLDMSMPGMGGIGFLRRISSPEGHPRYPVLVLTARSAMADFFATTDVAGFLAKPCDPADLLTEIARILLLHADRQADETVAAKPPLLLLGEDDADIAARLTRAFTQGGYRIECAPLGHGVLEKAITLKPDAIVCKRILAGLNGDAVAGIIKEIPSIRDIPFVLYDDTAAPQPEHRFDDPRGGIRCYVPTRDDDVLLKAINQVFAR